MERRTIREYRLGLGLGQGELSEKLGVSQAALSFYERGLRRPDSRMLERLGELFGCGVGDIVILSSGDDSCRHDGGKLCMKCGKRLG